MGLWAGTGNGNGVWKVIPTINFDNTSTYEYIELNYKIEGQNRQKNVSIINLDSDLINGGNGGTLFLPPEIPGNNDTDILAYNCVITLFFI